jgi:hypothetical protein
MIYLLLIFQAAGGLLGIPGTIDRPGGTSNVSAMEAAFAKNARAAVPPILSPMEISASLTAL